MARDSLEVCRRSRLWLHCLKGGAKLRNSLCFASNILKVVKLKVRASSNFIRWWNSLKLKVKAKTPKWMW